MSRLPSSKIYHAFANVHIIFPRTGSSFQNDPTLYTITVHNTNPGNAVRKAAGEHQAAENNAGHQGGIRGYQASKGGGIIGFGELSVLLFGVLLSDIIEFTLKVYIRVLNTRDTYVLMLFFKNHSKRKTRAKRKKK
jgi:hypothetical protein